MRSSGLKVAIPAEGPDFDAKVGDRLGISPYLLIVDSDSKNFESIRISRELGRGTGMQVVALIIAKKSDVVLTKWCSATASKYLSAHGVGVVTGMSGTVAQVLESFERENLKSQTETPRDFAPNAQTIDRTAAVQAVRSALHQIKTLLPVMVGVVLSWGLFSAFISKEFLASLFSGTALWDSFWGALTGSMFAGNPVNSYIISGELLEMGVSLVAVTAFLCAWVMVGLIQLPAESAALGWKFAVVRNAACFGLSMAISFVMMRIFSLLGM
jgi:predicted Fe-Mo cluster-binding NifX family protein